MIETNIGNHRQVGIDDVDRVQSATKADFQYHRVQPCPFEEPECRQGPDFEVGQRYVATGAIHSGKGFAELLIARIHAPELYALVIAQQMR